VGNTGTDIRSFCVDAAAIFGINDAIRAGNADNTWTALNEPNAHVKSLVEDGKERYQANLAAALAAKVSLV
jgi:hypothetical protein